MATRRISTAFAVEGETKFKQAIASCNSTLALLKSSLAATESRFRSSANTMDALKAKEEQFNNLKTEQERKISQLEDALKNCKDAVDEYAKEHNNLQAELTKSETALNSLDDATKKAGEQWAAYAQEIENGQKKLGVLKGMSRDTSAAQAQLETDIANAREAMKALEDATGGAARKAGELIRKNKDLNDAFASNEAKLDAATRGANSWEKQLNNARIAANQLDDEIARNDRYLEEARASADECATSIDQYGKEVKTATEASVELGSKGGEAINALAEAVVAAGIAEKVKDVAAALYDCVETFGAFQSQMSAVQAISGASAQDMEALAEKAKEMGASTSFTAAEAGQALEYMAMAGWKTGDMLDGLKGIMHLAAASGEDLASTSDIVTDALTAFGLKASDSGHFADVLAVASANANTNVGMMGETFQYAAPVAGALGYSIEDVAVAIGLMANSTIKGSSAGTALRSMLTNLAKPSKDVAEYMEALGVSLTDSQGQMRSLSELIGILRERFSQLTEAQKTEYAAGIAGKEAMSGLLAIVNASEEDYRKLEEAINSCNGAAKQMSETRLDNYAGQITLLNSAVDGLKLTVGEQLTPLLANIASGATTAVNGLNELLEVCPGLSSVLVGLVTAAGALTAAFAGFSIVKAITPMITAFNAALAANPMGLFAVAAAGVVAALAAFTAQSEAADAKAKDLAQSLRESRSAYQELSESMAAEKSSVADSVRALQNLLGAEEKSATRKEQIIRMVDELNEKIPGLGLAYDETADAINMTGEALEHMAETAREQEEQEARVARLNELYTEREAVTRELEDAQNRLSEAQDKLNEAMANASGNKFSGETRDASLAVSQLQNGVETLTAALAGTEEEITSLQTAATAYNEQQADAAVQTDEFTAKMEVQAEELRELEAAYNESYAAAMESIQGQIGLFQEMDGSAKTSVDSLIETLKGQVAYLETYNQNILKAMEMGVDEGLVRKLSDGSEKSAQILAAIVQGGTEDIQALNEQLAKVEEGKESFSNSVAEMETRFKEKMEAVNRDMREMVQELNLKEAAYKAGWNNIQGLIDGTADQKRALIAKYTEMGKAAVAAYKKAVDQHSPSREFQKAGSYDIRGIIQGAEAEKARLDAAYRDMARTALESMRRGLPSTFVEPRVPGPADQTAAIVEAVRGALGAGTAGGQGLSAADVAAAVREALSGMSVNMNQRKVGELVTDWQRNNDRGRGV